MVKLKKPKFETDKFKGKTKKLHERNFNKYGFDFHPEVSLISGAFVLLFIGLTVYNPEYAYAILSGVKDKITGNFNWFFILCANFFLVFPIYLMCSRLGEIKLGGPEAKPEFSNFSWYSMLMGAGMGIGVLFFGVAEPILHANSILPMTGGSSPTQALAITFLHWGFHGWGIYALIALALAFFAYNRGLPLSLRSVFYPVLKDKVFGKIGDIVDISAVIACLFGLSISLALGAQQINSGLNYLFGVPQNIKIQVGLIIIITLIATLSVVSGIGKGVRILSELNMRLAGVFLLLVLILGPTLYILRLFNNGLGYYLNNFITLSFFSENGNSWQGSWTIFYWAWWMSWSPFVGMFIARISKGRSVREFVIAILIVPVILTFICMSTFGATALYQDAATGGQVYEAVNSNISTALFVMIDGMQIPNILKTIMSVMGTFLVISLFVTSSDSGSLVVDNLTSGGKLDSPVPQKVFWASMEGSIAIALLVLGGNNALYALQAGVVASGFPFAFILLVMSYSLYIGLRNDLRKLKEYRQDKMAITLFNEKIRGAFENDEKIKSRLNID